MLGLYNTLLPIARVVVRGLAPFHPKLRAGLAGRRGWRARYAALGAQHAGNVVWLHSTSVGEYEQARPLAERIRSAYPDLVVFHTFFSPSGYEYARRLGEATHFDYVPEDAPGDVRTALDLLRPRVLVILKFDLWPNLVREAHRRGIPVLLLDATLQPRSWRSRWPARALYRDLYRRLDTISAVTVTDAERFRALVPAHPRIEVDGDTRFDQVLRRRQAVKRVALAAALATRDRPFTLVAGSTWPADEKVLLAAWTSTGMAEDARLLLVPHEPTPEHLAALEASLARLGIGSRRYSEVEKQASPDAPVILVDRVGILAELYSLGDVAFIGGAFSTGVHNLLEPAALGLPVLFGPRHHNAPEADLLLDSGGAGVIRSPADLARWLVELRSDPERRRTLGDRARTAVEANLGAADRCLERLLPHLGAPGSPVQETSP